MTRHLVILVNQLESRGEEKEKRKEKKEKVANASLLTHITPLARARYVALNRTVDDNVPTPEEVALAARAWRLHSTRCHVHFTRQPNYLACPFQFLKVFFCFKFDHLSLNYFR